VKRAGLFFFIVFFALCNARADSSFAVKKRLVDMPEHGQVATLVFYNHAHSFSFVPPSQFRSLTRNTNELVALGSPDGHVLITVNILQDSWMASASEDAQRSYVMARYPKCEIFGTAPAYSAVGNGRSFELRRSVNAARPLITKHIFLAYDTETVEIAFTVFAQEAEEQRGVLSDLLSSMVDLKSGSASGSKKEF